LYDLFGLNIGQPAPTLDELIKLTHSEDRKFLRTFSKKVFLEHKDGEIEIRVKQLNGSNQYRWFLFISRPVKETYNLTHVMGIAMDIQNRKLYEQEVKNLHHQLVSSARRAGMADVATSILHNVGNILNSINVSVGLLIEVAEHPYYQKILMVE